jgi:Phosphodiester glycosidase/SPOR domain
MLHRAADGAAYGVEVVARAVALTLMLLAAVPAAAAAHDGLPLGPPGLDETRTTDRLAPGVTYTRIERGHASPADGWAVDVAVLADRGAALDLARRLHEAGFEADVRPLARPPDDRAPGPLGYRVRSGVFGVRADADARIAAIRAAGLPARGVVFTAEDGGPTTGPWVVHVLAVEPRRVDPVLANDVVADRERLSAIAARHGAVAAINGGYFVIGEADGTPGDLAGSSILHGRLVSEAVDGRTDLLLRRGHAAVTALWDRQWLEAADGARRILDGENRRPGLIRACGGDGGDTPTELPLHDFTCRDPSELIRSTEILGAATEAGPGVEALLDGGGRVLAVREPRGGAVPAGGSVLTGTGDAADWLRGHARPGTRVRVRTELNGERGRLALEPGLDVVNGGPRLVRDGRSDVTAEAEGFDHPDDPGFYYAFGLRRNPRTIAGVARDGRLLLVAVDGRAPGYSAGLSFEEEAAVMRALGARDAVNLDGGGSTTMTVRGNVVTRPSDATGERPVADAIVIASGRDR